LYGYGSVYNPAATYANADGSYTFNLPVPTNLADGQYSLFYTGTDFNGGVTTRMERQFTIDNTAPTTPTITAPTARQWFKTTPITNSWTAATDSLSGISHYQVAYSYDDGHSFGSSTCPGLTIAGVSGFIGCRDANGTSRNHMPSLNEEGGVTIWVRALDNAGNASPWSQSIHYYYDHTAPIGDITFPTNGATVKSTSGKLVVTGTVHDNLFMNRVGVQLVKPGVSGDIQYLYDHMVYENPGTWQVEFNTTALGLADGVYGLNLYYVDMAGNVTVQKITFTLDNTRPTIVFTSPTDFSTPFQVGPMLTIEVSDPDGSGVDPANAVLHVYNASDNSPTSAWCNHATSCDTSSLPDGSYYVKAGVTDNAGNNQTVTKFFTIDGTAPVVTDTFTVNLLTNENKTLQPTVTDANSPLTYLWSVSDTKLLTNPNESLTGPTLAIGSTPPGTYTATLVVTDSAGNSSTPATYNITVSTPANSNSLVGGRGGGVPNTFTAGTPQVLGAETTTNDTTSTDTSTVGTDGQVKGDNVVKTENAASTNTKGGNFLGLGWWWLLILAAIAGLTWFLAGRRSDQE
jgi:hypothetical protein